MTQLVRPDVLLCTSSTAEADYLKRLLADRWKRFAADQPPLTIVHAATLLEARPHVAMDPWVTLCASRFDGEPRGGGFKIAEMLRALRYEHHVMIWGSPCPENNRGIDAIPNVTSILRQPGFGRTIRDHVMGKLAAIRNISL